MKYQKIVESLKLEAHEEGGFYRQTFETPEIVDLPDRKGHNRPLSNSIYYMLTKESPVGYLHQNRSPIMHYFHIGSSLTYFLITPEGEYSEIILGQDIMNGETLQLLVPGGYWKGCRLKENSNFALISEMVSPGWRVEDRTMASVELIEKINPGIVNSIQSLILEE